VKKISCLLMILFLLTYSTLSSFALSEGSKDVQFDDLMTVKSVDYNVPGLMITLVKEGKVIYQSAIGNAVEESSLPLDMDNTILQTGSISKFITTRALLQLMSEKGIDLEDSISNYIGLSNIPEDAIDLTFRDIFQHTTGIPQLKIETATDENPIDSQKILFSESARAFISSYDHKAVVAKGDLFVYSNVGYVLAGMLIESISGETYESYVADHVLFSMGMTDSALLISGERPYGLNLAQNYSVFGGLATPLPYFKTKLISTDDFLTSGEDMTEMLKVITLEMKADEPTDYDMFERQISRYDGILGRSLGLSIKSISGEEIYLQDGGIPGESSRLFFIPEQNTGGFIWYNSESLGLRDDLTEDIINILFEEKKSTIYQEKEIQKEWISYFKGAYTPVNASRETIEKLTRLVGQIRVSEDNGVLMIDKLPYVSIGESTFYNEESGTFAKFETNEKGQLIYLTINNTVYAKTAFYENLYLQSMMIIVFAVVNLVSLIILIVKWNDLLINRFDKMPRIILLFQTLIFTASMALLLSIFLGYESWEIAYGMDTMMKMMNVFSWGLLIQFVPSLMMIDKSKTDYRFTSGMRVVFLTQSVFTLVFATWLVQYNFIYL